MAMVIMIRVQFLYNNNGKYSVNYPGCEKWTRAIKHQINLILLNISLTMFIVCIASIVLSITLESNGYISIGTACILALGVTIALISIGSIWFCICVKLIEKNAQQGDAPECRT